MQKSKFYSFFIAFVVALGGFLMGFDVSFAGVINSAVSFLVQQLFPWELSKIGSSGTYLIYGIFAVAGLLFVLTRLPETKGKSLETLKETLTKKR